MTEDWGDPKAGGRDSFTPEGPGGRGGSAPKGPRISDLMSLEYVYGRHLTNFRFTFSSSELSSGRIPEGNITKAKLRKPHSL